VKVAPGATWSEQEHSTMPPHKFKVGDVVNYFPPKASLMPSARDYKVLKLLPAEDGQNQYRIKGMSEMYERCVRESDLSRK